LVLFDVLDIVGLVSCVLTSVTLCWSTMRTMLTESSRLTLQRFWTCLTMVCH